MILAALLYIRKVTETTTVTEVTPEYVQAGIPHSLQANEIPEGVKVFRIHGPFLFGAADKLHLIERQLPTLPKVILIRLRNMTVIDATGLHALESLAKQLRASGRELVLCGALTQPAKLMRQSGFEETLGAQNIVPTLRDGLARCQELLAKGYSN